MKKAEESVQSNDTGSASDPVKEERRRVKRSYGVSTTAVLFQILVINLVSVGANVVLQAIAASRLQAENPGATAEELKALVSEAVGQQAVLTTVISILPPCFFVTEFSQLSTYIRQYRTKTA